MKRPRVFIATATIVAAAVVAAAGYVTGGLLAPRDTDALIAADQPVFALGQVEERTIIDTTSITGAGVAADAFDVIAPAPDGTSRAVVTSAELEVGAIAESGTLLGSVSGRPIFALQMDLIGYRDLARGARGPDVDALHEALAALGYGPFTATIFDWTTEQALSTFYRERGFSAPSNPQARFVLSEFVTYAGAPPTVTSVAAVNTVLGAELPFMRMAASAPVIIARATVLEAERFAAGAPAAIRGSELDASGTVLEIGEFEEGGSGAVPGVNITVQVDGDVIEGQPYSITVEGEQHTGIAVPTAAIRQQAQTTFVITADGDIRAEVPVAVLSEADGWSRVGGEGLQVGQQVVIQ